MHSRDNNTVLIQYRRSMSVVWTIPYGVVKRKKRYHPAGSCDNFNMMSDYCREQLQSCEDYLIKYCKEKLQAENEGRSLEPDLSPKSMIIVDIVLSFGCVFMGEYDTFPAILERFLKII